MINSINWFEIPVTDFERAKAFYSEILNTSIGEMPFPEGRYGILAYDQQGVGGGLVQGEGFVPSQTGTIVYLNGGEDLNVPLSKVEAAGAKSSCPRLL